MAISTPEHLAPPRCVDRFSGLNGRWSETVNRNGFRLDVLVMPSIPHHQPLRQNNRDIVLLSIVALLFWLTVVFPRMPGRVFRKGKQLDGFLYRAGFGSTVIDGLSTFSLAKLRAIGPG